MEEFSDTPRSVRKSIKPAWLESLGPGSCEERQAESEVLFVTHSGNSAAVTNLPELTDCQGSADHRLARGALGNQAQRAAEELKRKGQQGEKDSLTQSQKSWVWESQQPLAGCVTPGKSLSLSELHCPPPVKSDFSKRPCRLL